MLLEKSTSASVCTQTPYSAVPNTFTMSGIVTSPRSFRSSCAAATTAVSSAKSRAPAPLLSLSCISKASASALQSAPDGVRPLAVTVAVAVPVVAVSAVVLNVGVGVVGGLVVVVIVVVVVVAQVYLVHDDAEHLRADVAQLLTGA